MDVVCLAGVRRAITDFIADRSSDTTPLSHEWEAFKCVLRGVFISHGTFKKKLDLKGSLPYYAK